MEFLLFTLTAVALYFFADWLLCAIERKHGKPLPNRNGIFFLIILLSTLATFELIKHLLQ